MITLPTPDVPLRSLTCALFAEASLFRDLLAHWLALRSRVHVVVRTGRATDLRTAIDRRHPDLLIVGLAAESPITLDVIRHYVTVHPQGRVVAVAPAGTPFEPSVWLGERLVASFDATTSLQEIGAVLDSILTAPEGVDIDAARARLDGAPLSAQESRVFDLIADGLTSGRIATSLGISEHTVRSHRKRISAKLGIAGSSLMRCAMALRQGALAGVMDTVER